LESIKNFIGLVNNLFAEHKINNNQNHYHDEIKIREILLNALTTFMSNMSYETRKSMSSDIFNKFQENRDFEKIKKVKVLFKIYSRKLRILEKKFFDQWKSSTSNNILNNSKTPKKKKQKSNLEYFCNCYCSFFKFFIIIFFIFIIIYF